MIITTILRFGLCFVNGKGLLNLWNVFLFQPAFYALYRSFTQCLFIEDEGDIVFYKNKHGIAARRVQEVGEGVGGELLDPGIEGQLEESAKRQAM
jgi:hypothetical protein